MLLWRKNSPYLADNSEAWVEVGETARRERGAARGELQEGLPLVWGHPAQYPHKAHEPRAVEGRAETKSGLRLPLTYKGLPFQNDSDTQARNILKSKTALFLCESLNLLRATCEITWQSCEDHAYKYIKPPVWPGYHFQSSQITVLNKPLSDRTQIQDSLTYNMLNVDVIKFQLFLRGLNPEP